MTRYVIDTGKIERNADRVLRKAGVPVWGIIKFDGYGAGLLRMAELLKKHGVDRFAVTEPEDISVLRESGFGGDVLLLRPAGSDEELETAVALGAVLSIPSEAYAARCAAAAEKLSKTVRGHIKVDTGLGRYGFTPDMYPEIRKMYTGVPGLSVEGIYTHFPAAFWNRRRTEKEFRAFTEILEKLKADGIDRGMAHASNSSALYGYDDMRLDAVRIGSAFLGRVAGTTAEKTGLERVGILVSEIAEVRALAAGSRTGYGNGKLILKSTAAAVAPIGHFDGLYDPDTVIRIEMRNGESFRASMIDEPASGHVMLNVTGKPVAAGDRVTADINPLRINAAVRKEYI